MFTANCLHIPGCSINLTQVRNKMIRLNNTSKGKSMNIQSLSIDNNLTALYNRTILKITRRNACYTYIIIKL